MKTICKLAIVLLAATGAYAQDTATNSYTQTNLVSDIPGMGTFTDPHLVNPWGLSRSANSYWWAADEATGVSTLYNGTGAIQSLVVTIPPASGTGAGTPTGTVAVGSKFVFVTLDGSISQWTSGTSAVKKVTNAGAVYTGVTLAKNGTAQDIYVANSAGGVEAYTTTHASRWRQAPSKIRRFRRLYAVWDPGHWPKDLRDLRSGAGRRRLRGCL